MLWLAVVTAGRIDLTTEEVARVAFVERLYREEAVSLVRLARLFTDDRTGAEDVVQEAFIRLYRSADRIQDPAKSTAYLRSIVLNLVRDQNRRGLMSLRHQDAMIDRRRPENPEDQAVTEERDHEVIEALDRLSARQRACLVLRYYSEMTEHEIAATLGISANSVKTHCRRGMAALAAALEVTA